MAVKIRKLLVKRMEFTTIRNPGKLIGYMDASIASGMQYYLYEDPHISLDFYNEGTDAMEAIKDAIKARKKAPTKANKSAVKTKMKLGKIWLKAYSDKVEAIANDEANRSTLEEASVNIMQSYLTPQKLIKTKKGDPEAPEITAKNVGTSAIDVKIVNGIDFKPSMTNFILLEKDMKATIDLIDGVLYINQEKKGQIVFKSANAKGRYTHFRRLKPGVEYDIYAYSQNGKDQISRLSKVVSAFG